MTQDRILGILRHVLTTAGGIAVSAGYLGESDSTAIVGGLVVLVGVIWSFISKKTA